MTFSHLFLLTTASILFYAHAEKTSELGGLKCTSQWMQYQVQNMKAFMLAFKNVTVRGETYVHSVIVGGKNDNPICRAINHQTFHEVTIKPGDCGTSHETLADGSFRYENFVDVELRVPMENFFLPKRFRQNITCTAGAIGIFSQPVSYAVGYTMVNGLNATFNVDVDAKLEMTYENIGHMVEVPVVTLTFTLTNPADDNLYNIYIDNCNVSESSDPTVRPLQQILISRGIPNPTYTNLGLLEVKQQNPLQLKVAAVGFTDVDMNQLYYHCQVNKCTKDSSNLLCSSSSRLFRHRRSTTDVDTIRFDPLSAAIKKPQRFLYRNGKIVMRKNAVYLN